MRYYVIPDSIPEFYPDGQNILVSSRTRDGRRVCAVEAAEEFPGLFVGRPLMLVELTPADFPDPPATGDLL